MVLTSSNEEWAVMEKTITIACASKSSLFCLRGPPSRQLLGPGANQSVMPEGDDKER